MSTDDTRPLADELGLRDDTAVVTDDRTARTVEDAAPEATEPAATAADRHHADDRSAGVADERPRPWGDPPVYRRGPAPFGLFLGVVGLALALGVLVTELVDVDIPWSDLGPWVVVVGGLLVVLVGLLGLRANRSDD